MCWGGELVGKGRKELKGSWAGTGRWAGYSGLIRNSVSLIRKYGAKGGRGYVLLTLSDLSDEFPS